MPRLPRLSAVLLATAALVGSLAVAAPAGADLPPDPLVGIEPIASIVPDAPTAVVNGPFVMTVKVTGGGAEAIVLTPDLPSWAWWAPSAPSKTIPGGTCTQECQVSWTIDPASQATPWYEGFARVGVSVMVGDRPVIGYGTAVIYQPVVRGSWVKTTTADPTVNTPGYASAVFDIGGQVTFEGMNTRAAGEHVDVLVLPPGDNTPDSQRLDTTPLASATGSWAADPAAGYATGTVHLDTAGLPEGRYRLVAQARDDAGHYAFATPSGLVVRHSKLLRLEPGGTGQVATGREIGLEIWVNSPRADTTALGDVKVTVGGATTRLSTSLFDWYEPTTPDIPSQRVITIPTAGLPLGPTPVAVEVLDARGGTVASGTTSIDVVSFQDTVTIPTLVVGKNAALHLKATAPAGTSLLQCQFILYGPTVNLGSYNMCPGPKATTVDATTYLRPEAAGASTVREDIIANDNVVGPQREFPVTVYANRTATFTAPSTAGYNTTQTATITVKDEKKLGVLTGAAGVTVSLQRKKAGTTTWVTIANGTTGSTGLAVVKYTNTASGRLRTVVKGAVPGATVTTAERAVTSVATVAWSSLPTSARSGYTVTAAVYAKPYEKGATIRFQARKYGATSWASFGSGTVGTSGYAKATARLYSRGTWEVRVQRVGTTAQATGYSSTRRIKVY